MKKIDQLLSNIINKQHVDSKQLFDSIVRERINDKIQEKRVEVASNIFNKPTERLREF
jgi:ribosomal protein L9